MYPNNSKPSVKHVLGVLEWSYMLTEKYFSKKALLKGHFFLNLPLIFFTAILMSDGDPGVGWSRSDIATFVILSSTQLEVGERDALPLYLLLICTTRQQQTVRILH